ncbi:Uu.00g069260.m01.CDS01 [Anthostomella pinea]|uniref:Uu.00g069260.m01.CDS01 n=1 Tax=Anthostomella pinea TaxID=933095 RepID=A0AAI8YNN7_9PEZI|nr:Uu.00g069260.m01.CDS01 [Anthostomella pinea]
MQSQQRHSLLDLPPELIRPIIRHALKITWLRDSVKLRQVNRLFESEVMAVIEEEKLLCSFDTGVVRTRGVGFFGRMIQADFMAAYLLRRPHKHTYWNSNISVLLNSLVDEIMALDGVPVDDVPTRYQHLLALSCVVRQNNDYLYVIITGRPVLQCEQSRRIIDGNLRTRNNIFGTYLCCALWGRQHELARYILEKSYENSGLRAHASVHRALQTAVVNGDLTSVQLLLEPAWGHNTSGSNYQKVLVLSIRLGHRRIADLLLSRAHGGPMHDVAHNGLREACFSGDLHLVRRLLDRSPDICLDTNRQCTSTFGAKPAFFSYSKRATPVEATAKQGHEDILKLLIERGANPDGLGCFRGDRESEDEELPEPGSLSCAACGGHIGIAKILLGAGVKVLPDQWKLIVRCAIEFSHIDIVRYLIVSKAVDGGRLLKGDPFVLRDMMAISCRYGSTEAVKSFADKGVPVDGFYEARRTPWKVALAFDQRSVLQFLRDCGVNMVHPSRVPLREYFERDEYLMGRAPLLMHPGAREGISC